MLINAVTNDCNQNIDIENAHNRLGQLVSRLQETIADVTIIISSLIPSCKASIVKNYPTVNAAYRTNVASRRAAGQKIVLAEMDKRFLTAIDL